MTKVYVSTSFPNYDDQTVRGRRELGDTPGCNTAGSVYFLTRGNEKCPRSSFFGFFFSGVFNSNLILRFTFLF